MRSDLLIGLMAFNSFSVTSYGHMQLSMLSTPS